MILTDNRDDESSQSNIESGCDESIVSVNERISKIIKHVQLLDM